MKQNRKLEGKWIVLGVALVLILLWAGIAIYKQFKVREYYLDEPIAEVPVEIEFEGHYDGRLDFAVPTIRYEGHAAWIEEAINEETGEKEYIHKRAPSKHLWYIKQGSRVVAEVPADGLERQTSRGRTGVHTVQMRETLEYSLEDQDMYLEGSFSYVQAVWPDWMTPNIPTMEEYYEEYGEYGGF